jgi:hypothetical protein
MAVMEVEIEEQKRNGKHCSLAAERKTEALLVCHGHDGGGR